jgi:hypothetical protein
MINKNRTIPCFIIFLLLSCTPSLSYLKSDPQFIYSEIHRNKIFTTKVINKTSNTKLNDCNDFLNRNFKKIRPYYEIVDYEKVMEIISQNDITKNDFIGIENEYSNDRTINKEKILELGRHLGNGYLIISKITNYSISHENTTDIPLGIGEEKHTARTKRSEITTLKGTFTIFNLQNANIVFDVKHQVDLVSERTTGCLADIFLGSLFLYEYSPNDAVEVFFKDVLKNFPEK